MLDTIKGEVKVFTKEVERDSKKRILFNACVGATKTDDGYINYYMPVNFSTQLKKDVAKVYKNDSFDVIIKEAWIKAYKDKDDNVKPMLFINKATIITGEKPKAKGKSKQEELDTIDNLPF